MTTNTENKRPTYGYCGKRICHPEPCLHFTVPKCGCPDKLGCAINAVPKSPTCLRTKDQPNDRTE